MKGIRSIPLLLLLFFFVSILVDATPEARAQILASREKRRKQLENVLEHVRKQLKDHYQEEEEEEKTKQKSSSSRPPLTSSQVEHFEHKIRAYEHQLEELSRELDEEEIQIRINNYHRMKNGGRDEL